MMPDLGQTTADYSIGVSLKNEGDRVERGETLVEVETDKAIAPVEAYCSGYLRKILCRGAVRSPRVSRSPF